MIAEIADAEHVVASDCCRPLGWPAAVSWWRCAAGSRAIAGYPSSTWPMYAPNRTGGGASGQVVITDNGRYRLAVPPDRLDAAARSGGDWPPAHPNSLAVLRIWIRRLSIRRTRTPRGFLCDVSLAFRAAGRPQGPDPDVRHRDIRAGATGWSTYVFYQRKQVRCSDANMVVAKTGMITAAIDVAVRGQAIEPCAPFARVGAVAARMSPAVVGLP